jgi:hypothetical protein
MLKNIGFTTRSEKDNAGVLPGRIYSTATLTVEMVGSPEEMNELSRLFGVNREKFWSVVTGETKKVRPWLVGTQHPALMEALQALGIDVVNCQKVVIEIGLREPIRIYTQLLGDEGTVGVVKALENADIEVVS